MKKCIASFLICFVFAFGLITAFGSLDKVYAVPSDAFKPVGNLVSGTINVCDSLVDDHIEIYTLVEKNNSSSYAFLYHSESSNVLSLIVYSTSTVDCALHYHSEYIDSDNSPDDGDKNFTPSSFSCSSNGYTYALSFSNYYMGHNWDTYPYNCNLPVVTVPDSYFYNPQAILNTVLELDGSSGFEFTIDNIGDPEYSSDIGFLTDFKHYNLQDNYVGVEDNSNKPKVYENFQWSRTTSEGYTIQDDDTVCLRLVVSYGKFAQDTIEYSVSGSSLSFSVDRGELLAQCDSVAAALDSLSWWERYVSDFGNDTVSLVAYACVYTSDGFCGDWTRLDCTYDNGYDDTVNVGSFDDSGNFVSDPSKTYTGSHGTGLYDEDTSTIVVDNSNIDLDLSDTQISDSIQLFISAIKSFVSLVSVTFSFLPDWALAFVSLSVVIFCIMIVKRAIF